MKISVLGATTFIGKNIVENLKNIRDGKNRTRPNLSVSAILLNEAKDADVVIMLPGSDVKSISGYSGKVIYISTLLGSEDEKSLPHNSLIYRMPEIVGKWQEPKDGIAYLCHAIANDEEYVVESRLDTVDVLFIDDFISEILDALDGKPHRCDFPAAGEPSSDPTAPYDGKTPVPNEKGAFCYSPMMCSTTIGNVIDHLESFNCLNTTLIVPEMPQGSISYKLYSMYLSYLPERKMSYPVNMSMDNRGVFTELFKTVNNGQVSINIARPGNIRGQHWHNTKWEIFVVVSGHGLIQEREIGTDRVLNFEVRGEEMRAVIMLPGYTHNIINLEKDRDLVTVMFANEQFDQNHPDTFFEVVDEHLTL